MSKKKTATQAKPWQLTTPPGTSKFEAWVDGEAEPPALVVQVGKTQLRYDARCIDDLHAMLSKHGDWMLLGSADEQKPAAKGTVECELDIAGTGQASPRSLIEALRLADAMSRTAEDEA